MPIEITILGTSSAVPTLERHPSCQHLNAGSHHFLIDCGEAAQIQMLRYGVRASRIEKIFISHLHPDHILGLPGMLSSQSLQGRKTPVEIYAPSGLREILETQFTLSSTHISYDIEYIQLEDGVGRTIFEDEEFIVQTYSLQHRIPCWGFVFREKKPPRKIKKDAVLGKDIPVEAFPVLRSGKNYKDEKGMLYSLEDFTEPNTPTSSYGYFTDTLFLPQIAKQIGNVDLIYHEATFAHQLLDKAEQTLHSTASQAAEFAKIAGANRLIIGHFSSRYKDLSGLLEEARNIFPETQLANEGDTFTS